MATSELRKRLKEQGVSSQAVADALNIPMIVETIIDGPPSGRTYDRIIDYLDHIERDGSYMPQAAPPDLRTKDEQYAASAAAAQAAFLAPRLAAQEAQSKMDAWLAADRERVLANRADTTARYVAEAVERVEHGRALMALREDAGLTLRELGALLHEDFSMLSRLEHGKPMSIGTSIPTIDAGYAALLKMTPKKSRQAASR